MKDMYYKILATIIYAILGFNAFNQEINNLKLNNKDYPFLNEKEIQFATKKDDFKIGSSNYSWKEWVISQENGTDLEIVYRESDEPNKLEGTLIFDKDTFQIYGSNGTASLWSDKLKGILYIYPKTEPDELDYYFYTHIASINLEGKKYKIEIVKGRSSNYEEGESELISEVDDFKFDKNRGQLIEYRRDSITLKYYSIQAVNKETGDAYDKVNGTLFVGNSSFEIYGSVSESEGVWGFASIWQNGENKGVISWEAYEDADSSIVNIKYCKQEKVQFCDYTRFVLKRQIISNKNNPFGSGGNGTNGGFVTGKNEGVGIGQEPRKRITKLNLEHINVSESVLIDFKVNINRNGDVTSVYHLPSGMKVIDPLIIEELKNAILTQLKYEKSNEISSDRIKIELRKK